VVCFASRLGDDLAPDLHDVLDQGLDQGWGFVCLDGTLISCTRSSARSEAGHDVWYSGKHKQHGGNIQVLTDPHRIPGVAWPERWSGL
jgi:hypothetical protein